MAATTGHSINTVPYRENTEISVHSDPVIIQRKQIDYVYENKLIIKTRGSQEPVSFTW
jgi:hypothetical protein